MEEYSRSGGWGRPPQEVTFSSWDLLTRPRLMKGASSERTQRWRTAPKGEANLTYLKNSKKPKCMVGVREVDKRKLEREA